MTVKWDTRAEIGLRAPKAISTNVNPTEGCGYHYGGVGPFKRSSHDGCRAIWRAWQAYHMSPDNKNNYNDIAYNLGVCHHGYILEGRSTQSRPKVRGGANGNATVNYNRLSIVFIWGREDGKPTAGILEAFWAARKFLMDKAGMGSKNTPHRKMSSTSCPGDYIVAAVTLGPVTGGTSAPTTPSPSPSPDPAPSPTPSGWDGKSYPGRSAFRLGHRHPAVTVLDKRLIAHGYTRYHDGDGYQAGPRFTDYTLKNVQAFQRAQGWRGSDADGYPGPVTWQRLMAAPKPKPAAYVPPPFPTGIAPGKTSPSAKGLQRALKAAGYMPGWVPLANNYGPRTRAGVITFHKANPTFRSRGVVNDPRIGPKGWAYLHKLAHRRSGGKFTS